MNSFDSLRRHRRVEPSGAQPFGMTSPPIMPPETLPPEILPPPPAPSEITPSGRPCEQGSATIFVVGFAIVLFAAAGLAIDGGRAINARDKATDVAEQAARAGADQLDKAALRHGGAAVLDQAAATLAADSFVRAAGYTPTSTTDVNTVTVRAAATYTTTLLGIVGINTIDVSGVATASPDVGINGATP